MMEAVQTTHTSDRAGTREWIGLAVLALPTLLLSIDATVLYLALPHLATDLAPTGTETLWIIDIYGFMIAGSLITMGTLGDRIGRRRLLMIGAAGFGVASVIAAYAVNPTMLIVARALLGIAGATLMPSSLALITDMFRDLRQRRLAISVWTACFSAGLVLGPLVGGALLELFWWGSVFLLAVPVMVTLMLAVPVLLPESRAPEAGRIDLVSVVLSLAAILPIIFGLKELGTDGFAAASLVPIAVGGVFLVVFLRRQRTLQDPLLDLSLFRRPAFVGALLALFIGLAVIGIVYLLVTQHLQLVSDFTPLEAGMWLLPSAVAMIVSSLAAPALTRWVSPGVVVASALVVSAIGYLLLGLAGPDDLASVIVGLVVVYLGTGPVMALGTDLVVGTASPQRSGSAAALSETSMEFGLAFGVAVLGTVFTATYQTGLAESRPAGLTHQALDASNDSLAGALNAANQLPDPLADALISAARGAFSSGLNVIGIVSAAATALAAVAMYILVYRTPRSQEADADDDQSIDRS